MKGRTLKMHVPEDTNTGKAIPHKKMSTVAPIHQCSLQSWLGLRGGMYMCTHYAPLWSCHIDKPA